MTKIDIVSGFLGAGKTTLIKKLLAEVLHDTKTVLIENEFGEIGIDGGFLRESGIEIREMNSGCICCSLVGDFGTSLSEVIEKYHPDRILIEPSGVGKLSDVIKAVKDVKTSDEITLNSAVAVVDAIKCKMYIKNFGEFFINQIENAGTIILSRTNAIKEEKLNQCIELIRNYNQHATIVTTPWEMLKAEDILATIEGARDLKEELLAQLQSQRDAEEHDHNHEHHDHEHGESCGCGHHDHDHEHHDHEHGESCGCGHHDHDHEHHDHEHGESCGCGHDHGHHHADEVFESIGHESPATYTESEISDLLEQLEDEEKYGLVLRAKGMVPGELNSWIYFDYVPGEKNIRTGRADVTGKICIIGAQLKEESIRQLLKK